jgi:polyhydroxyalkanoate synthase
LRQVLDLWVAVGEREWADAAVAPAVLDSLGAALTGGGPAWPGQAAPFTVMAQPPLELALSGLAGSVPGLTDWLAWLATRPALWGEWLELSEAWQVGATRLAALVHEGHCEPGANPREPMWRSGNACLWRYSPPLKRRRGPPVVVVYSLINRPEVLDLAPGHSLIGALLSQGHEVWLLDWGEPLAPVDLRPLETLLLEVLVPAVAFVCAARRCRAVDLLGVCQGGTLALIYASLPLARVRRLVTLVTPVSFAPVPHLLGRWATALAKVLERAGSASFVARGNLPAALLHQGFVALRPFRLGFEKYLGLADHAEDPGWLQQFGRMERWIASGPAQPALASAEFLRLTYGRDALWNGQWRVGDLSAQLEQVRAPVCNLYALQDHLVPPAQTTVLGQRLPPDQYRAHRFDGGHIGIFTSRRATLEVFPVVAAFLRS